MVSKNVITTLILIFCSACSTVMEGKSQVISIDTAPEGATCTIKSNDDVLGIVRETPGVVTIAKSKNDVLVECTKEGFLKSKKKNISDMAISSFGNAAFLQFGIIGSLFDSSSGANYKYDAHVMVELEKDTAPPPQQTAANQPVVIPQQSTQPLQQMYLVQLPISPSGQPMLVQPTMAPVPLEQ